MIYVFHIWNVFFPYLTRKEKKEKKKKEKKKLYYLTCSDFEKGSPHPSPFLPPPLQLTNVKNIREKLTGIIFGR